MRDMTISEIRYTPYCLPMTAGFTTMHGTQMTREGAIVEIISRSGLSGIGEIAPLSAFAGGDLVHARASLSSLANHLRKKQPAPALALLYTLTALSSGRGQSIAPAALYGLETALLDLLGQSEGKSVAQVLRSPVIGSTPTGPLSSQGGAPRQRIPVNAVIGAAGVQEARDAAAQAVQAGFGCIKLKMGNEDVQQQIARVQSVRAALPSSVHLRLDANEGWSFEMAQTVLAACEPLAIQYVEQPLSASDLTGMRKLRAATSIPLAADEAVHDRESVRRVLTAQAADVLILKPQLVGGLRACRQVMRDAAARGVQCVVTSTLEAGVGVAGALHLVAASPEVTLECGLATLPLLADDLLVDDLPIQDGFMALPSGPGLGVRLDRDALEKYTL